MVEQLGTTAIPGSSVTVRQSGTVAVSAAFEATLGLVGGMDTSNGDATPGDVITIGSAPEAAAQFGENSELARAIEAAFTQRTPPNTIYAVGVSETTNIEQTFSAATEGTLDDAPVFDPTVQPEHEITAVDGSDTDVTVSIVYESPPASPNEGIALNPITGEWAAATSGDYTITYSKGDYTSAIQNVISKTPRILTVLTENESVGNELLSQLTTRAEDFEFTHGIVGAPPNTKAADYSDSYDNRRLSVIAPSRGYVDEAEEDVVRMMAPVGGLQAGRPLGNSMTYTNVGGVLSLQTEYTTSELADLIDSEVMPIRQSGGVQVVKDMTTATEVKFERLYASEIVDESAEIINRISQQFVGDRNREQDRDALAQSYRSSIAELTRDGLLENYVVRVEKGADDYTVDVTTGIDVIGIMDNINVDVNVGEIITFEGAA